MMVQIPLDEPWVKLLDLRLATELCGVPGSGGVTFSQYSRSSGAAVTTPTLEQLATYMSLPDPESSELLQSLVIQLTKWYSITIMYTHIAGIPLMTSLFLI